MEGTEHHSFSGINTGSSLPGENGPEDCHENVANQQSPRSGIFSPFWWAVLSASLLVVVMQAALDSTITADSQPAIIHTFGEESKFPWISVTYSLGMSSTCLLW